MWKFHLLKYQLVRSKKLNEQHMVDPNRYTSQHFII